jgi:exodeoxyribonuclease-5
MNNMRPCAPGATNLSLDTAQLTEDQTIALAKVNDWWQMSSGSPFDRYRAFLIDGAAGTGKTYCLRALLDTLDDLEGVIFTAPTNKAVRVLRQTLKSAGIHSPCLTIYSALGLKMAPNGEIKELTHSEKLDINVDWNKTGLCILDEASMVSKKLMQYIEQMQRTYSTRMLYLGDSAQLPPVGESISPAMRMPYDECHATLTKVVRQDNQILTLGSAIRESLNAFIPKIVLGNDHDDQEGVWKLSNQASADRAIIEALGAGLFSQPTGAKCIAWRNVTVNKLNQFVRSHLFPGGDMFCPDDRIICTEPCTELVKPAGQMFPTIHTTDTEGTIQSATLVEHPWFTEFEVWKLTCLSDDGDRMHLYVLDQTNQQMVKLWKAEKEKLLYLARNDPSQWGKFWGFIEAFHSVRHGYAITSHRSQGSTYEQAFVNFSDIFCNQNRSEAFKCLYVACSRPKKKLFLW